MKSLGRKFGACRKDFKRSIRTAKRKINITNFVNRNKEYKQIKEAAGQLAPLIKEIENTCYQTDNQKVIEVEDLFSRIQLPHNDLVISKFCKHTLAKKELKHINERYYSDYPELAIKDRKIKPFSLKHLKEAELSTRVAGNSIFPAT